MCYGCLLKEIVGGVSKKLNDIHTYTKRIHQKENKRFGPLNLSSLLATKVHLNPSIKAKDVMREKKDSYDLDIKYHSA